MQDDVSRSAVNEQKLVLNRIQPAQGVMAKGCVVKDDLKRMILRALDEVIGDLASLNIIAAG